MLRRSRSYHDCCDVEEITECCRIGVRGVGVLMATAEHRRRTYAAVSESGGDTVGVLAFQGHVLCV